MLGYVDYLGGLTVTVTGAAMFVVSLVGCLGVIRENYFMIKTFAMCLSVFLLSEVAFGIYLYAYPENVVEITRNAMMAEFRDYFVESRSHYAVNEIQRDLRCCGVDGPIYWNDRNVTALPDSCCPDGHGPRRVVTGSCGIADAWQVGCLQKSTDLFRTKVRTTVASTGSLNLIGIGYALYLASSIKKEERRLPKE